MFHTVVFSSRLEQVDSHAPATTKSLLIPHGVPRSIPPASSPVGHAGVLTVGFLGRLDPKKNVDLLIEALRATPSGVRLIVAGDGPAREYLIATARAASVANRVHWMGFVDARAKSRFFASVDVVAMPSAYECFGIAGAEALAAGIPVIVSPFVGLAEVIERYQCGLVVQADPGVIATQLSALAFDKEWIERLSVNALRAADAELSIDKHVARLQRHYSCLHVNPRRKFRR